MIPVSIFLSYLDYYIVHLIVRYGELSFYHVYEHIYLGLLWFFCPLTFILVISYRDKWVLPNKYEYLQIIFVGLVSNIFIIAVIFSLTKIYFNTPFNIFSQGFWLSVFERGVTVSIPTIGFIGGYFFYKDLQVANVQMLYEKEILKNAKIKSLKQTIGPHFLFNNLNVLSSLIYQDSEKADLFLNSLSKLYRYIVDHNDEIVVSLDKELEHIENYISLLKWRFSDSFKIQAMNQCSDCSTIYIIPNTLQALIENAIKHNELNPESPLIIKIEVLEDAIIVRNKKNESEVFSNGTERGLYNLKEQYRLLFGKEVIINNNQELFEVKIPTIRKAQG